MFSKKAIMAAAVAAVACFSTASAEVGRISYSYAAPGSQEYLWGTKKAETIDIAIRLADPGLVGKRIIGIEVPVNTDEGITNTSAWITTKLAVSGKSNVADVCTKSATWDGATQYDSPILKATFDEPYTIPAEGAYVGYSFTVTDATSDTQQLPITVAKGSKSGGLYIHTSRTYLSWKDVVPELGGVSFLKVILEGEVQEYAASINSVGSTLLESGKEGKLTVGLTNFGTMPVTSVEYSYTVDGINYTNTGTAELEFPIDGVYGATGEFQMPVTLTGDPGKYNITVNVNKINDQPNTMTSTGTGTVSIVPFLAVKRPLMEEYTGLWCGYCPRGFVAMERLNKDLGDLFVGVAYHYGNGGFEPMEFFSTFPNRVSGFPASWVDRKVTCDPYYGESMTHMGIRGTWDRLAAEPALAAVDVAAEWTDATHLKATTTVRFVEDFQDADYRVAYILTGDNMTGEEWKGTSYEWKQANNFPGQSSSLPGEDASIFTASNALTKVRGLVFNDVALQSSGDSPSQPDFSGVMGSIPNDMKAGETATHEYTFDLTTVRNSKDQDIVNDPSSLRIVAIVVNAATGEVVNSVKSKGAAHPNAVGQIAADSNVVASEWYDLHGRRLAAPAQGLNIRVDIHADGKRTSSKVSMR